MVNRALRTNALACCGLAAIAPVLAAAQDPPTLSPAPLAEPRRPRPSAPAYVSELFIFVTLQRRAAAGGATRVRVGTYSGFLSRSDVTYWFLRDQQSPGGEKVGAMTSSATCPQAVPVLRELEDMPMPSPDVPGYKLYYDYLPLKDVSYTISGLVRHGDGQPGKYSIGSRRGSPLALWTESLLAVLEPCWVANAVPGENGFPPVANDGPRGG